MTPEERQFVSRVLQALDQAYEPGQPHVLHDHQVLVDPRTSRLVIVPDVDRADVRRFRAIVARALRLPPSMEEASR